MGIRPAPSTLRAIAIVTLLKDHGGVPLSVVEIARRLEYNRATCQAVLLALEEAGWVRRAGGGGYAIGAGLSSFGPTILDGIPIVEVLKLAVADVHNAIRLEVLASVVAGGDMVIAARAGPSDPFSTSMRIGQSMPLIPPFGLAFVAWDEEAVERWMARMPNLTSREMGRMRKAAELVRRLGYCVTLDPATRHTLQETVAALARGRQTAKASARQKELTSALAHDHYVSVSKEQHHLMRVSQISAPIFGSGQDVLAIVCIHVSPGQVQLGNDVPTLGEHLRRTTHRLTRELGGSWPGGDRSIGNGVGGARRAARTRKDPSKD